MASLLLRTLGRQCMLRSQLSLIKLGIPVASASSSVYEEMREFWNKNRRLKRPLSPHLTIYKPQLTSMLSLCHRVTGIVMSLTISSVSVLLLTLPGDFTHYLQLVKDLQLNPALITGVKFIIAFPVVYHYINGIRHLAWDACLGFDLKTLYKSGYFVTALALTVSAIFASL